MRLSTAVRLSFGWMPFSLDNSEPFDKVRKKVMRVMPLTGNKLSGFFTLLISGFVRDHARLCLVVKYYCGISIAYRPHCAWTFAFQFLIITSLKGLVMLKKLVLLSGLLLTSLSAQATLISHFGYERDSASNIVTGYGLEWLKWDVTTGMGINTALSTYASQGWRLASNDDMAFMFNQFKFGKDDWHADESVLQEKFIPWNSGDEFSSHAKFIHLFGATRQNSCSIDNRATNCYSNDDPLLLSYALFGADVNLNRFYNIAVVRDDAMYLSSAGYTLPMSHHAFVSSDQYGLDFLDAMVGVALVRDFVPDNVAVPTPGSIGLLALGLVALGYRRRQVLGR